MFFWQNYEIMIQQEAMENFVFPDNLYSVSNLYEKIAIFTYKE